MAISLTTRIEWWCARDDRLADSAPYKGPDLLTADIDPTSVACSNKISQTETEEYSILPSIHSIGSYPINNSWSFFFCSETSALGFVRFFVSVNNSDFIVMFYTLDITCLLWDARMRCPGLIAVSYRSLCYYVFWCFALTASLNHFRKTSLHFAEY